MGVWGKKSFFQEVFFPHEKNKINKKGRTPDEGSPSSFAKAKEFTLSCVLVRKGVFRTLRSATRASRPWLRKLLKKLDQNFHTWVSANIARSTVERTMWNKNITPRKKQNQQTRENPRRGFSLFLCQSKGIHPLLRFVNDRGNFALCGVRQGLRALDCASFWKSLTKTFTRGQVRT